MLGPSGVGASGPASLPIDVRASKARVKRPATSMKKIRGRTQPGRCIDSEATQIITPSDTSIGLARHPVVAQNVK